MHIIPGKCNKITRLMNILYFISYQRKEDVIIVGENHVVEG